MNGKIKTVPEKEVARPNSEADLAAAAEETQEQVDKPVTKEWAAADGDLGQRLGGIINENLIWNDDAQQEQPQQEQAATDLEAENKSLHEENERLKSALLKLTKSNNTAPPTIVDQLMLCLPTLMAAVFSLCTSPGRSALPEKNYCSNCGMKL